MRLFTRIFRKKRRTWAMQGLVYSSKKRIYQLFILLIIIILAHTAAMMIFEKMTFGDALWLSLTTINTTGYGDLSSETLFGRMFTVLLMYGIGITLMAQVATEYIEYRLEKKERKLKGFWSWQSMKNHIVIIHIPKRNPELYLHRLISQLRKTPNFSEIPVCIVTQRFQEGIPRSLLEQNVVHVHGEGRDENSLHQANIMHANHIIILSNDSTDIAADSTTLDVLLHLKHFETKAQIIAESVKDSNRYRFKSLGVTSVLRPIRAYPELVVRAMEAPGTEQVMENLFAHEGDHPIRINLSFTIPEWRHLTCLLINEGLGTVIGYIDHEEQVITNPPPFKPATGKAIILLVHQKHIPSDVQVKQLIEKAQLEESIHETSE